MIQTKYPLIARKSNDDDDDDDDNDDGYYFVFSLCLLTHS